MGAKILIAKPQYRDNATGEGDYSKTPVKLPFALKNA